MLDQSSNASLETLGGFTRTELIVPELFARTAPAVISELCALLHRQGHVQALTGFQDAVLARETISPTAFVNGWALPHARLRDVPELRFVVGRTAQPVAWFGNTTAQVQTIFLFAVPEDAAKTYLNIISAVARLTQNVPLVARLRAASDASGIFEVLKEVPLPHSHLSAVNRGNPRLSAPIRT